MVEGFLQYPEMVDTARHVELVREKIQRLKAVRDESWAQLLTAVARRYRAGEIDLTTLDSLRKEMSDSYGTGYSTVWNEHMPMTTHRLRGLAQFQSQREQEAERDRPNGPEGSWLGEIPIQPDQPRPPKGTAVVYVVFDDVNQPAYVGSTADLWARLSAHRRRNARLTRWAAYPCASREDAYLLEDRLLKQYKPYMNAKASR